MARRAETTYWRRPVRAPYRAAPVEYAAVTSATMRQAAPTEAISGGAAALVVLELRRALRHERVALGGEDPLLELARDDHLAAVAERVRDGPRVADRHRGGRARAVGDLEDEHRALVADRARHDLPRHLVSPSSRA